MPMDVEDEIAFPLPEEIPQALGTIVELCLRVLQAAGEDDIADWARNIRDDLDADEIRTSLVMGFDLACKRVIEAVDGNESDEIPVTVSQVVEEMGWIKRRLGERPQDVKNNLGLSEIALESWKDLCEGHPVAKIAISTIKELVQITNLLRDGEGVTAGRTDDVIARYAPVVSSVTAG